MPYQAGDTLEIALDPEATVWRYMNLAKFVSLLQFQSLFFVRVSNLGDRFEGTLHRARLAAYLEARAQEDVGVHRSLPADLQGQLGVKTQLEYEDRTMRSLAASLRDFSHVNCWSLGDYESAALWKIYVSSQEGVAVRSTVRRLRDALALYRKPVTLGVVRYVDYESEAPDVPKVSEFLAKRRSFDFEREIRALVRTRTEQELEELDNAGEVIDVWPEIDPGPSVRGLFVPVNVECLVSSVHVSPGAPAWFKELVEGVMRRYDVQAEVRQSSLDADPIL